MFTKLSKDCLPKQYEKILLVGKQVCQIVKYLGCNEELHQFQQDDYGIWTMTNQQLTRYAFISIQYLTQKVSQTLNLSEDNSYVLL